MNTLNRPTRAFEASPQPSGAIPRSAILASHELREKRKEPGGLSDPFSEDRVADQPTDDEVEITLPDDSVLPG